MKNVSKHRVTKIVNPSSIKRRIHLLSDTNYNTKKMALRKSTSNRKDKTEVKMNKPVYLALLILDMSKIIVYEYWYDYTKPKCGNKATILHGHEQLHSLCKT